MILYTDCCWYWLNGVKLKLLQICWLVPGMLMKLWWTTSCLTRLLNTPGRLIYSSRRLYIWVVTWTTPRAGCAQGIGRKGISNVDILATRYLIYVWVLIWIDEILPQCRMARITVQPLGKPSQYSASTFSITVNCKENKEKHAWWPLSILGYPPLDSHFSVRRCGDCIGVLGIIHSRAIWTRSI